MARFLILLFFLILSATAAQAQYPRPLQVYIPDPPARLEGQTDRVCLAVAVYHEARGEQLEGQYAVASVILQRAETPGRWGRSVCSVIVPVQFSFLDEFRRFPPITEEAAWRRAIEVADAMLEIGPLNALQGADHYHADTVRPVWRYGMVRVGQIGDHIFYRDPLSLRVAMLEARGGRD